MLFVADRNMLPDLLHGNEKKVWGDAGYWGQSDAIHEAAPQAQNMTNRRVKKSEGQVDAEEKRKNRTKSRVCARVEWSFRILRRVFHYTQVRYRGIKKNHEWLLTAFALVILYKHRKRLALLLAQVQMMADGQANVLSFGSALVVMGMLLAAMIPLTFLLKRPTKKDMDSSSTMVH